MENIINKYYAEWELEWKGERIRAESKVIRRRTDPVLIKEYSR